MTYSMQPEHGQAQSAAKYAANTILRSLEKYVKCIYYLLKGCQPGSDYRYKLRDEFKQAYSENEANTSKIINANLDTFLQLTTEDRNDFSHYNTAEMNYEGIKVLEAHDLLVTWLVYTRIYLELKNEPKE